MYRFLVLSHVSGVNYHRLIYCYHRNLVLLSQDSGVITGFWCNHRFLMLSQVSGAVRGF